jgi:hypothetical protein
VPASRWSWSLVEIEKSGSLEGLEYGKSLEVD